jgi:hypothetical protein
MRSAGSLTYFIPGLSPAWGTVILGQVCIFIGIRQLKNAAGYALPALAGPQEITLQDVLYQHCQCKSRTPASRFQML